MGDLHTLQQVQPPGGGLDAPVTWRDLMALQANVRGAYDPVVKFLTDRAAALAALTDSVDTISGDLSLYQLRSEKAAASGYADLDSSTQVPNARIKWDAPSAIGGTTPAAGKFSALDVITASEDLSVWGLDTTSAYIDGTGTAGANNTAQTVKSITLKGGKLDKVGRKVRFHFMVQHNGTSAIVITLVLNGVTIGTITTSTTNNQMMLICYEVSYLDATHSNILPRYIGPNSGAAAAATDGAANTAGFAHGSDQTVAIAQSAVASNHITVFELYYERNGGA